MNKSRIVLDACCAAAFALPEEIDHAQTRRLLMDMARTATHLIAPPLYESEVDSIIRRKVYMGTLTAEAGADVITLIDALQVKIVYDPLTRSRAREIAAQNNQVRVYDSTYAAFAEIHGLDLWTADKRFYNAVKDSLPFVKYVGEFA